MKTDLVRFSQQYAAALRKHLRQDSQACLPSVCERLGQKAVTIGLDAPALADIHGQALVGLVSAIDLSRTGDGMPTRAHAFFAGVLTPVAETHRAAVKAGNDVNRLKGTLRRRAGDPAVANRKLKRETSKRKKSEEALKESRQSYRLLLTQFHKTRDELRCLTHRILSAQEEERKKISRELHDGVVQTLTGINIQLATLKKEVPVDTKGLKKKIAGTQRLVAESVKTVHRFACDLRPALLDDMGLIPALHSYMKDFAKRTGIRVHLRTSTPDRIDRLVPSVNKVLETASPYPGFVAMEGKSILDKEIQDVYLSDRFMIGAWFRICDPTPKEARGCPSQPRR